MSFFNDSVGAQIINSTLNNVGGDQTNYIQNFINGADSVYGLPEGRVTYAAFHNSAENENASKCFPNTRDDIMKLITAWVRDRQQSPICWVYGPAGSGKSTIAYTMAEQFRNATATFFFTRDSAERTVNKNFFPTVAFQLATLFPHFGRALQIILSHNPSFVDQKLQAQLENLILSPFSSPSLAQLTSPVLVIVDGLDECQPEDCRALIRVFVRNLDSLSSTAIRILLFSRRESFILEELQGQCYHLDLWRFPADNSIYHFYRHSFSEIRRKKSRLMQNVKQPWPSDDELQQLVQKTGGLFIYASTLVKFVEDDKGLPEQRLQKVLSQYSGLDGLYHQILGQAVASRSQKEKAMIRNVIGTMLVLQHPVSLRTLLQFLDYEENGEIRLWLDDCISFLMIPDSQETPIQFYHASLPEFLMEEKRSQQYYINPGAYHIFAVENCLLAIERRFKDNITKAAGHYACNHWYHHMMEAVKMEDTICEWWVQYVEMIADQWFALWHQCAKEPDLADDIVNLVLVFKV
ncbi:hypothetical protein VKT23_012189 [Stygiomarasmius scandens]|uniref:Nephrocystin 3-like N-terminal domain-containing protein n=1 Tax=Marasmiellus scandens TaxID=2682957 RepID=A0ABR1J9T0_9AGAR